MSLDADAIVVGAGPSGAACAICCTRRGVRVLLLDKARFPRPKTCGCCLSARACSILAELAGEDLLRRGMRLWMLDLRSDAASVRIPLRTGCALSRECLDASLVDTACDVGAEVWEGANAVGLVVHADHVEVAVRHRGMDTVVRAKVIVCADGLAQSFTRVCAHIPVTVRTNGRIGAGARLPTADIPSGVVVMCVDEAGYAGLVRLEDGTVDLACALDPRAIREKNGLHALVSDLLGVCGIRAALDGVRFRGTPTLTRTPATMGARRVLLVGDAGGYVEPISGEGIAWALTSGVGIAPIVERACRTWDDHLIDVWARRHRRLVGRRRAACRVFAWGLRRGQVRRGGLRVLARVPPLARGFVLPFEYEGRP